MARIVIIIEDQDDGSCRTQCTPNAMELANAAVSHQRQLTAAETYALIAMRTIAEKSLELKRQGQKLRLILPPGIM